MAFALALAFGTLAGVLPAVESGAVGVLFIVALPANVVRDEPPPVLDDAVGGGGGGAGGGANGVCAAHDDNGPGR